MNDTKEYYKRVSVDSLDKIIGHEFKVLNKGFVRVIDYMGNDNSIVQAARVSYGEGTQTPSSDEALIRYLLKNKHTTPFEMCEIKLHIKAPIFVARQWIRHRTANVNEYSARYSILEQDYYTPEANELNVQSKDNKQGRGEGVSTKYANEAIKNIQNITDDAFKVYKSLLEESSSGESVAREIARIVIPVNVYTQFYWKIDLHNLLHFLELRVHPHAQYEIRVFAETIINIVKEWLPITYKAFVDYKLNSVSFSKEQIETVKKLINGNKVTHTDTKMSKREWQAFADTLNITN